MDVAALRRGKKKIVSKTRRAKKIMKEPTSRVRRYILGDRGTGFDPLSLLSFRTDFERMSPLLSYGFYGTPPKMICLAIHAQCDGTSAIYPRR